MGNSYDNVLTVVLSEWMTVLLCHGNRCLELSCFGLDLGSIPDQGKYVFFYELIMIHYFVLFRG